MDKNINKSSSLTEKISLCIIFLIVIVGVILSRVNIDFYNQYYVKEDCFTEWLGVVALISCAFLYFYRLFTIKFSKGKKFFLCLLFSGLIFLFGAGEEISWGQRIFHIETPEFFKKHNAQQEMNLHNLVISFSSWSGDNKDTQLNKNPPKKKKIKINKIVFGAFLAVCIVFYFLILPILYRKKKEVRDFTNTFALPIPKIIYVYAYILLFILSELAVKRSGELLEFGGCWIILLMMLYPYNKDIFSKLKKQS
ncbi:MAG: hypothetical protein JJV91_02510 [Desulfosarcina sp.]|nr:hypothetical protein [Desulfobacterales bacterium]